nr:MAG TPA: hypothetical protein [Caudoviricetes sp.]
MDKKSKRMVVKRIYKDPLYFFAKKTDYIMD